MLTTPTREHTHPQALPFSVAAASSQTQQAAAGSAERVHPPPPAGPSPILADAEAAELTSRQCV